SSTSEAEVTVSASGYNDFKAKIAANDSKSVDIKNNLAIVPAGKIYFLSKLSGKIDVVKTNLDGSDRQTVLAGTGNEDDYNTVLLASRDWKYLLLQAKRDAKKDYNALYIIDTQNNDKLITADEGNASFNLAGWSGHDFAYLVTRQSITERQSKRQAIKIYHADTGQLATLDETRAESHFDNYVYERFDDVNLLSSKVIYTHSWITTASDDRYSKDKQSGIAVIDFNGSNKKDLKTLPALTNFWSVIVYKPDEIYFNFYANSQEYYVQLEDSTIKDMSLDEARDKFNKAYPTYLLSPSGKSTFWSDERDGKDLFLIGDDKGDNGKEITRLEDYGTYGWYTDNYVLLSKKGSELYIMGRDGGEPIKITDYHKPAYNYRGYGGGYGGL
ncbi:MAG TPA: hypothetical protein VLG37_05175, partial [Candidatus Saccharimonadales bacterium]|nr:hypothetical protein [Candidatus Saccharimonadales bacterium]